MKSAKYLKRMLPRRPRVEFKRMKIRFSHVQNRTQFREHHPPLKVLQTGAKHQRSPKDPLFSERSTEWNEDMEELARRKADDNHIGHCLEEGANKLPNIEGNGEGTILAKKEKKDKDCRSRTSKGSCSRGEKCFFEHAPSKKSKGKRRSQSPDLRDNPAERQSAK